MFVNGGYGRAAAPSGASVGIYEAKAFPESGATESLREITNISSNLLGVDASDVGKITSLLREFDGTGNYSKLGGSAAYAISIAAAEAAAKANSQLLFEFLNHEVEAKMPYPIGNVLGGGKHAGPGAPDIQEFLVCPVGAGCIQDALNANFEIHREVKKIIETKYPSFPGGKGDEGAWAPSINDDEAFDIVSSAIDNVSDRLGFKILMGIDVAASSLWSASDNLYHYQQSGIVRNSNEQLEYLKNSIEKHNLLYVEDPFHEDDMENFKLLTETVNSVLIVGDDLLVTNPARLEKAASMKAGNAGILKVNQAGSLGEALEFSKVAQEREYALITSHRSGDTCDSQIAHIALATGSVMLKSGIVGGERVAKLNELLKIDEALNGLSMVNLR